MWLTALRGILARKLRVAATATAVLLGVALMAGTLVLTDTVTRTFNDLFGDVYASTDVVVRGAAQFEGPQNIGVQRARLDDSVVATVAAVPGVAVAEGGVTGYARIVGKNGKALGNPSFGAPTLGFSWGENPELNPFRFVAGRAPAAADEVVIDAKSARDGDLAVGDVTTVLVQGPPRQFTVVGIVKFGTADSPGGATVAAFDLATAQALVAAPGKLDEISVIGDGSVTAETLAARVADALPTGVEVVTGAVVTEENQDAIGDAMGFFTTFMLVFALVALLVGAFMIYNAFSITVAQRTREHGLLRALGARRRQILGTVLVEALIVGVTASLVGLGLGVVVAMGLQNLLAVLGLDIPTGGIVFAPRTVVVSLLTGVTITVLASLAPARRASAVSPMAALRTGETAAHDVTARRILAGSVLLAGGVGALVLGLFGQVGQTISIVGAGVLGVFAGTAVLGPVFARPLSRLLGSPIVRLRGVPGDLARENAMRNPRRTAATASALMIGVGLVGFITVFVSSTKASIDDVVQNAFNGDLVVDSGAGVIGGVSPDLAAELRRLPEVAAASGLRLGAVEIDGSADFIGAMEPSDGFRILDVGVLAGSPTDLAAKDAIAVHIDTATERGLAIGDTVEVRFTQTGAQDLRVAMIYAEDNPAGAYVLGMPAYEANFPTSLDRQILVQGTPGVSPAALQAAVEAAAKPYIGVEVLTRDGYVDTVTGPLNQLLALVYVLLSLAILIALLGIANTLALSIHERVREIGLLRAVGMTRGQLRAAIRWESMIIALQGAVLGLAIGVFFGWVMVRALRDEGITLFQVPYPSLALIAAMACLAGVLAGIAPARRAARLDVLQAVAAR